MGKAERQSLGGWHLLPVLDYLAFAGPRLLAGYLAGAATRSMFRGAALDIADDIFVSSTGIPIGPSTFAPGERAT